jgi:hypothetical protein
MSDEDDICSTLGQWGQSTDDDGDIVVVSDLWIEDGTMHRLPTPSSTSTTTKALAGTDMVTIDRSGNQWGVGGGAGRYVDRPVREPDDVWRFQDRTNATYHW